jgi:hypothetical protein
MQLCLHFFYKIHYRIFLSYFKIYLIQSFGYHKMHFSNDVRSYCALRTCYIKIATFQMLKSVYVLCYTMIYLLSIWNRDQSNGPSAESVFRHWIMICTAFIQHPNIARIGKRFRFNCVERKCRYWNHDSSKRNKKDSFLSHYRFLSLSIRFTCNKPLCQTFSNFYSLRPA